MLKTETVRSDGISYTYSLIENYNRLLSSFGIPLYSIEIRMIFDDTGEMTENKSDALFSDIDKASDFFNKLVRNLATPIDLPYIVEDELYK